MREHESVVQNILRKADLYQKQKAGRVARIKQLIPTVCVAALVLTLGAVVWNHNEKMRSGRVLLNGIRPNDLSVSKTPGETHVISLSDYQTYRTSGELVQASDVILTGKLTDISFAVINIKTGEKIESVTDDYKHSMLVTLYTVIPDEKLKGKVGETETIAVMGGIPGYDEGGQRKVLEEVGLDQYYDGIWISDAEPRCNIAIGNTYLFCVARTGARYDIAINPVQFAFDTDSENAKAIIAYAKLQSD